MHRDNRHIAASVFKTPLGWCAVAVCDGRVAASVLPTRTKREAAARLPAGGTKAHAADARALAKARDQLTAYFAGERRAFDLPLDLSRGTDFQRAVWRAVRTIPFGQTRTYGQVAALAGRPNAARAVGGAMAANPVPPLVPCHRVVAADGPGGFMGGCTPHALAVKHALLDLESAAGG